MNPCEMGYDCPHRGRDEDGEDWLCLYPHTRYDFWMKNHEIRQTFPIIECVDCPLEDDFE